MLTIPHAILLQSELLDKVKISNFLNPVPEMHRIFLLQLIEMSPASS